VRTSWLRFAHICRCYDELMKLALAADHAGFPLKALVIDELRKLGDDAIDLGTNSTAPVDYPDYAQAVARAVLDGRADRAVLVCGSGAGACVAASKFPRHPRRHLPRHFCGAPMDDVNVLCLGARVIAPNLAVEVVRDYVNAKFSGAERHRRRLGKVAKFEADFGATSDTGAARG
jgi:ribose 5-phosphate isomerase B